MGKTELTGSFGAVELLGDASDFVDLILSIVDRITLFEDFSQEDIACLARRMRACRAGPGVELIREGESGDFMLLLLEGTLEIVKIDSRGLPQRMAIAGAGKTLGEMSLIDGEPRFASCVTLEPTLFAVLDRESLAQVISDEPRIGVKILMELLMLLNQRLRSVSGDLMRCLENQRLRIR